MSNTPTLRQGSPAKRAAIVRAALDTFVQDGYARASVDAIAKAAGVSKRTIYDYYGGKERLFLSAVEDTMAAHTVSFQDLLDRTLKSSVADETELEAALTAFGRTFATEVASSDERAAVMRLMIAEAPHFPALLRMPPRTAPSSVPWPTGWPNLAPGASWTSRTRPKRPNSSVSWSPAASTTAPGTGPYRSASRRSMTSSPAV